MIQSTLPLRLPASLPNRITTTNIGLITHLVKGLRKLSPVLDLQFTPLGLGTQVLSTNGELLIELQILKEHFSSYDMREPITVRVPSLQLEKILKRLTTNKNKDDSISFQVMGSEGSLYIEKKSRKYKAKYLIPVKFIQHSFFPQTSTFNTVLKLRPSILRQMVEIGSALGGELKLFADENIVLCRFQNGQSKAYVQLDMDSPLVKDLITKEGFSQGYYSFKALADAAFFDNKKNLQLITMKWGIQTPLQINFYYEPHVRVKCHIMPKIFPVDFFNENTSLSKTA